MSLLDHFTRAELLAAADAAEVYPVDRAEYWAVNEDGARTEWPAAKTAKYS